jgi:drug/metabolite transporter (DMT)-like permease
MKSNAQVYFLLLGIAANALWAAAFIIPYGLLDFSSEIITISRYTIYGAISTIIFLLLKPRANRISWRNFFIANLISFSGNVGYYYSLTVGIKKSGFIIPTLIVGMLPVSVILISYTQHRKLHISSLLPGIGLMVCGIFLVNWAALREAGHQLAQPNHVLGIASSLVALMFLTLYFVLNVRFLKMNPGMPSLQWTSLLGICALLHSVIFAGVSYYPTDGREILELLQAPADRLMVFVFGVFFLGIFVSYLAMWMWNISSRNISEIMGARILCLEALFALLYGYLIDFRLPNWLEVLGAVFVIAGGYFVQRQHEQQQRKIRLNQA